MPRRLPAPWRVERIPGGYVVCDANGQNLAYVYSRATEAEALQAEMLTDDEAPKRQPAQAPARTMVGPHSGA
jgi:hypothetical protein